MSPRDFYTVNIGIPTSSDIPPSPDPDAVTAVIGTRETAGAVAEQLKAVGQTARVEPVFMPEYADAGPGLIGYRVRVGHFATEAEADRRKAEIAMQGFVSEVHQASVNGKNYYRIQIGPVAQSQLATVRKRLADAHIDTLPPKVAP